MKRVRDSDSDSEIDDKTLNNLGDTKLKQKDNVLGFSCKICSNKYKKMKYLKQHMQSHNPLQKCELCGKMFVRLASLRNHQKKKHDIHREKKKTTGSYICSFCNKTFPNKYNLTRHYNNVHKSNTPIQRVKQFQCVHCDYEFHDYTDLINHVEQNHPLNQKGGRMKNRSNTSNENIANAINEDNQKDEAVIKENNSSHMQDSENVPLPTDQELHQLEDETALRNGVINRNIIPRYNERFDV